MSDVVTGGTGVLGTAKNRTTDSALYMTKRPSIVPNAASKMELERADAPVADGWKDTRGEEKVDGRMYSPILEAERPTEVVFLAAILMDSTCDELISAQSGQRLRITLERYSHLQFHATASDAEKEAAFQTGNVSR